MTCHSAHYVQAKPSPPREYRESTVKKTKKSFGAQFSDDEVPQTAENFKLVLYGRPGVAFMPLF
jgi:hypothetical protein